jgi:hypothetical protein
MILPASEGVNRAVLLPPTLPDQQPFSASTTAADLLGETSSLSIEPPASDIIGSVCI